MLKKAAAVLLVLVLILAAGLFALAFYVKPAEPLDLNYSEVSIYNNIAGMVRSRKLEMVLSPEEVSSLLKKQLAAQRQVDPDTEITGADFIPEPDGLLAKVNVRYKGRLDVGAQLDFDLVWEDPYLTVTHKATRIRDFTVPAGWFRLDPIRIDVGHQLPPHIGIKSVRFTAEGWAVDLKVKL